MLGTGKALLIALTLLVPQACFPTLLDDEINVEIEFQFNFLGYGLIQHHFYEVTASEGSDLIFELNKSTVSGAFGNDVVVIPEGIRFEIDILSDKVLIRALSGAFFGEMTFTFSDLEWQGTENTPLNNVSIAKPQDPAPSGLQLISDPTSFSVNVLNEMFSVSPFSEIELDLDFVSDSASNAVQVPALPPLLILTLFFIVLSLAYYRNPNFS